MPYLWKKHFYEYQNMSLLWHTLKNKKIIFLLSSLFIIGVFVIFITSGYAGDHWGDYLNDQAPTKYTEATGWRKIAGYVLAFAFFFYAARQIWKTWRNK